MAYSTTHDNTRLYVKDWGAGQPAILLHDWPLSADSWDEAATNFRPDLAAFTVPTLVIHGTQDKTVPIDATGRVVAKAVPMPPTSSTTGCHTAYSPRTRST